MIFDEIDRAACQRCRVLDALAHPQLKHLVPASLLGVVIVPNRLPPHHGFSSRQVECDRIPPAGALEAFVVDETVYLFEDWRQDLSRGRVTYRTFPAWDGLRRSQRTSPLPPNARARAV